MKVTKAVAVGNLSQQIEVDTQGEILEHGGLVIHNLTIVVFNTESPNFMAGVGLLID